MTDEQLRALVRDAVARHLAQDPQAAAAAAHPARTINVRAHISHGRYALPSGDDAGAAADGGNAGPCFIEPTVRCNHCGFCQSHGH